MWQDLFSSNRLGIFTPIPTGEESSRNRTAFQRDYDRIIFSSPFRRLQTKTTVFPLPGNVFVHNRLTHSLEAASIGRSIGNSVGNALADAQDNREMPEMAKDFYRNQLGNVIAAACLAHDIGYPPFGRSGENAISQFFISHPEFKNGLTESEWADLANFEGNANALRVMAHRFNGRREGGFCLTYTTLISMVKYPRASNVNHLDKPSSRNYGVFQSEIDIFRSLAGIFKLKMFSENPMSFVRHPFAVLVEAADDISTHIIDLEDAHRLGIVDYTTVAGIFLELNIALKGGRHNERIQKGMSQVAEYDKNERLAYLRAITINNLISAVTEVFVSNRHSILEGRHDEKLVKGIVPEAKAVIDKLEALSMEKIYNHPSSIEVELAGNKVLTGLLSEFVPAVASPETNFGKKLQKLIPLQYHYSGDNPYRKIQVALDFITGMTDEYAMDLFRKLRG